MSQKNPVCRACGGAGLLALDCLVQAPVGLFPSCAPLRTALGYCPACTLIQRTEPVTATGAVRERTGAAAEELAGLATRMVSRYGLGSDSLVIEVGSGEGTLLRHYREAGVPVLGLETDRQAARIARQRQGIPTREVAFSRRAAEVLGIQGLQAQVLHAHHVLDHTADLIDCVRGIRRVLCPQGIALLDVTSVHDVLTEPGAFVLDQHLNLFSLTSLCHCFTGHGLLVEDVERPRPGVLRLHTVLARPGAWPGDRVTALLSQEERWGVRAFEAYAPLARHTRGNAA